MEERVLEPTHEWIHACAATGNDYQKDRQFQKINSEKDSIDVAVVRGGKQLVVPNVDILVGDVMLLNTGDKVAFPLRWMPRSVCATWLGVHHCIHERRSGQVE